MAYHLTISDPSVDGVTGHHTIVAAIEEEWTSEDGASTQLIKGTPEKYGIDASALTLKFAGDVDAWVEWVGIDLLAKHRLRRDVHGSLEGLVGKRILIEP